MTSSARLLVPFVAVELGSKLVGELFGALLELLELVDAIDIHSSEREPVRLISAKTNFDN